MGSVDDRRAASKQLRETLAPYRGGHFESGDSGGSGGMMFFVDRDGQQFFIGGLNAAHAHAVTNALNLVLELLEK